MLVPVRSRGRICFYGDVDDRLPILCIVDDVVDCQLFILELVSRSTHTLPGLLANISSTSSGRKASPPSSTSTYPTLLCARAW
jgi:hypothetical protein